MKIAQNDQAISQAPADTHLRHAAQQFEGLLLGQLLAPLLNDESGEEDGAASQVRQTAVQALATSMSASGGIGLAGDLVRHMQHEGQAHIE